MRWAMLLFATVLLVLPAAGAGEVVVVREREASLEATLALRSLDGLRLAQGHWSQSVDGDHVTTRFVLRFEDGSLHDETVVFAQRDHFRLIRDRLVQSGPSFPQAIDMTIDGETGRVVVTHSSRKGKDGRLERVFAIPADLANGMVPTLLKNIGPAAPRRSLSLIVATPSPRLVRLEIRSASADRIPSREGGGSREATHYVLKAEIGGVAGFLAPLVGRQPPDSHVWIAAGGPPVYLRSDQPFYVGGPLWRIEVVDSADGIAGNAPADRRGRLSH